MEREKDVIGEASLEESLGDAREKKTKKILIVVSILTVGKSDAENSKNTIRFASIKMEKRNSASWKLDWLDTDKESKPKNKKNSVNAKILNTESNELKKLVIIKKLKNWVKNTRNYSRNAKNLKENWENSAKNAKNWEESWKN